MRVLTPLKHVAEVSGRVGWHGLSTNDYLTEGDFLVTGTDLHGGGVSWHLCHRVSSERWQQDPRIQLDAGDVLITKDGTIGKIALVNDPPARATLNSGIFRVRPSAALHGRFLFRVFESRLFTDFIELLGQGSTINHLYERDVVNFRIPLPPLGAQCAIADYLDTETARIDALITKKQRMTELLREQFESRLAATFDVHGIPTPALSVVVQIVEGQVDPKVEPFASMMLVAPDHVESGTGRLSQATSAADQGAISGKYLCQAGDVIYSKIRPALRKVCIATEMCLTSADMYPMRPSAELDPRYLSYFLLSDRFSSYAVMESERVAMPKINRDAFGRIRIPIPAQHEQKRVVDDLDAAQSHLRSVSDRIRRQSELLREYRQALITAAVTGDLEIPGLAA